MALPTHRTIVREILNSKLRALLKNITSGDVLEVGAGRFNNYKSETPYVSYVTLDINSKHYPDIVSNIHSCSITDESFNIVLMIEVLEHCHNPQKAIDEVHRILRTKGICIISTRFMQPLHERPYDYYRFTPYSLQLLLKSFQEVKIYPMGNWITNIFNILCWWRPKLFRPFISILKRMYGRDGGLCPLGYIVVGRKEVVLETDT